ncbi:helix-turn-helix domain-containing protein [Fodinisporobacter ferrooxydans]|uniref:Helix-turn-helix domain-containing protein n=1 Tax=Fodinisporobacter ferrooxydans TaxID=2901836 RepID=A0ABY4CKP3_9BACL|nr:helix-turn-helix domain-containing protein [Alicyclobacillaceae bacterium MYW30-H2]
MSLGERLKIVRIKKNWNQTEAADRINIKNETLSQYERDRRKPDPQMLAHIAKTYDVSIDYLMEMTEDPTPVRQLQRQQDLLEDSSELTLEESLMLEEMRKNTKFAVAFNEFLSAPQEKKKEFLRMWKVYKNLVDEPEDESDEE